MVNGNFFVKWNEWDKSASEIRLLGRANVELSTAKCKPGPQHDQENTNQNSSYGKRQENGWGDKGGCKQA
jgi:hypothetical protein